jgi:hypothetical protein
VEPIEKNKQQTYKPNGKIHEIIPEWLKEFPAGRGKKAQIAIWKTTEKKQKQKQGYYPIHFDSKSNIAVSIGIFKNKPYPILFPETATLHPKKIEELLAVALFLYRLYIKNNNEQCPTKIRIPKTIREIYNKKRKGYLKWLKKQK